MILLYCHKDPVSASHIKKSNKRPLPLASLSQFVIGGFTYCEKAADYGEDYDCGDGDDDAVAREVLVFLFLGGWCVLRNVYQLHALRAETTGFIVAMLGVRISEVGVRGRCGWLFSG